MINTWKALVMKKYNTIIMIQFIEKLNRINKLLKISLDEGYVFDILSILEVKCDIFNDEKFEISSNARSFLEYEIFQQIGIENFSQIIKSEQYKNLKQANLETFRMVDLAQNSIGLARDVDSANYERYLCKKRLQETFFEASLTELKNK